MTDRVAEPFDSHILICCTAVLFDDDDGTFERNIYKALSTADRKTRTNTVGSEPGRINLCHLHEVYGICSTANEVDDGTHDRL